MTIQQAIAALLDKHDLSRAEMQDVMQQIMTGQCTDAQIGGWLIALRMKGETVDELTAAAQVMSALAEGVRVDPAHLIDIVGTGGDSTSTFNVSTAASFVAAGAGATVAKHGNRAVSSSSGSADVLELAGANLSLNADQVSKVIKRAGVGFMFAPMHHSAMRHAIGARKEMAVRTLFNVLGPLTNPANVKRQVIGVYAPELTATLACVFAQLGSEHTLVVHSHDGMDELSVCAPTQVSELQDGHIRHYEITPEELGIARANLAELVVSGAAESLAIIDAVFAGQAGAPRDMVALNAGAGIYVAGLSATLAEGVQAAYQAIDDGRAATAKSAYIRATQEFS